MELPLGFSQGFSTNYFPPILILEKLRNIRGGKIFGKIPGFLGINQTLGEIFRIWNSQGLSLLWILEATFGIGDEVPSQKIPGKMGITGECGNKSRFFPPGKAPATFRLFLSIFWGILAIPRHVGTSRPGWEVWEFCLSFPKFQPHSRLSRQFLGKTNG